MTSAFQSNAFQHNAFQIVVTSNTGIVVGFPGRPSQQHLNEVWKAWQDAKAKKKKKKFQAIVAEAGEAIETAESRGFLAYLPAIVVALENVAEAKPVNMAAAIQALEEITESINRLLDEEDEEIMLLF